MYQVEYVSDEDLPTDWAFVREPRRTVLFMRASAVCPALLEEAWAAFAEMQAGRIKAARAPLALTP